MISNRPITSLKVSALVVGFYQRRRVPARACKVCEALPASRNTVSNRDVEAGATAVEFVFVLPLLVGMFYAIFTYGYIFVLHQALNYASEEAARAAVAVVSGGPNSLALQQTAANLAVNQALSFMPASQRALVGAPVLGTPSPPGGLYTLQVTLNMPIGGLFPVITLPLIGPVPVLPTSLNAISID